MLPTLPLEIWELIFGFLPGQDLELISKVPRFRDILTIARRSAHRLEVHRAGLIDVSSPGSRSIAERAELLKAYRTRWESLRWTEVTSLPPRTLWIHHFAGDVLAYIHAYRAPVVKYLRLPFGGNAADSWDGCPLELEYGIKTFSAYPKKNLLAVLEEWFVQGIPNVRLHIRKLDPARDIVVSRDDQLVVCEPFTTGVDLDVHIEHEQLSCEIEQIGYRVGILFACYTSQGSKYCAKFIMWDVTTQEQVANITSWEYRSFVFLDHHWVLFGALVNGPDEDSERMCRPYLEIADPTNPGCTTKLELDRDVSKHPWRDSTVDISIGSGVCHEDNPSTGDGEMPFVSDTSRGIISADVYCYHRGAAESNDPPLFESFVFILDVEDMLSKAPSPQDLEQRSVEWKDLSPSVPLFSYASPVGDRYRIFSRHSYVTGFRYASPIQPLDPENPNGPRCFFVYDFNPLRETSDTFAGTTSEDPDPKASYPKRASEITREVVGGLSCWKMRFDLPVAQMDIEKCHVALTDGGTVLFELSVAQVEFITVFSMW